MIYKSVILVALLNISPVIGSLRAEEQLVFSTPTAFENISLPSQMVLQEAYRRIGVSFIVTPQPAERSLHTSNEGGTDGEVFRAPYMDKIYSNLIMVKVPINYEKIVVFSKNKELDLKGWQSIKKYNITTVRGIKVVEEKLKGIDYQKVTYSYQALKMLERGRTEIVILPYLDGLQVINNHNLKGIEIHTPPLMQMELFHYLHKKHKSLIPKITGSLEEMKKEGEIKRILERFVETLRNNQQ